MVKGISCPVVNIVKIPETLFQARVSSTANIVIIKLGKQNMKTSLRTFRQKRFSSCLSYTLTRSFWAALEALSIHFRTAGMEDRLKKQAQN